MSRETFRAFQVQKTASGKVAGHLTTCPLADLPPGELLVQVAYSSVNYKDALSATGHPGVTKNFPHVPGIDAAGIVVDSRHPDWQVGEPVIVTGHEFGSGAWGGYAEYARVPAGWAVRLPPGLSLRESMMLGTAGFTAALSVQGLIDHGVTPESGEVVVTGAGGGVGTLAVAILSKLGYQVSAVSGKPVAHDLIRELGAENILGRMAMQDSTDRPLLAGRWAGGVDTVGGEMLANVLRATMPFGCVTTCGMVAGHQLDLTVYPFILRGITLMGIASSTTSMPRRLAAWERLAEAWKPRHLDSITREITLADLPDAFERILKGQVTGRLLVRVGSSESLSLRS